ncbi:MAG: hypothetical protein ABIW76_16325 [Fibrobacteria bacterium]
MKNSLQSLAVILCLSNIGGFAQAVKWQGPGSFDYTGHFANTPPYPKSEGPMNPAYTATVVESGKITASVGGLAWLPNGDLLMVDFVDLDSKNGALIILKNLNVPGQTVTSETIMQNFSEPLGLQIVDGVIYVGDQKGIWKIVKDASGTYAKTLFSPRPVAAKSGRYPYAFNLEYANGSLYYSMGCHNISSPENAKWPGFVYKVDMATGAVETLNSGMRMPNGMGVKKETGDLFYSDNQGEWRKASPVFHVIKGAFNGHPALKTGGGWWPAPDKVTPPAVWLPTVSRSNYGNMTRSSTGLHEVEKGIYKGTFLMGDNYLGRINRIFFEKVKGVYQGATFHFSNTVKGGIQHFIEGPDGTLFGGALGTDNSSGWNWQGVLGAMTKWTPNQNGIMDVVAIRSNQTGFDLEFTEPLAAADIKPDNFWVVSYAYNQWSESYGGSPEDVKNVKITSLESSADRKRMAMTLEGLAKGRVYNFFIKNDLKSEAGNKIHFPWAWYTLNEISDKLPLESSVGIVPLNQRMAGYQFDLQGRSLAISNPESQTFSVKAFAASGKTVFPSESKAVQGKASIRFSERGVYILRITSSGFSFSKSFTVL